MAEDNAVGQVSTRTMLESLGCRVDMANDGREALALVFAADYDFILLDCEMPAMNGCEPAAQIRQSEVTSGAHPRIVAMP